MQNYSDKLGTSELKFPKIKRPKALSLVCGSKISKSTVFIQKTAVNKHTSLDVDVLLARCHYFPGYLLCGWSAE